MIVQVCWVIALVSAFARRVGITRTVFAGRSSRPAGTRASRLSRFYRSTTWTARASVRGYVTVTTNGATRTFFDSAGLEAEFILDASERGFGEVLTKRD